MLDEIKKLTKHTGIYGMGNILGKMVGFFMIPFYTHYLTPADYGTLELLDLSLALIGLVLTMWMNASIIRHYYDYDEPKDRNQVVSTILLLAFGIGVIVAAAGIHWSRPLSSLILKTPDLGSYIVLISLSFLVTCLNVVSWSYLRARQRSGFVVSCDLVNLVLTLSLNIYFIAFRHTGVVGVLYSSLISNSLIAAAMTVNTIREVSLSFSLNKLRAIVVFGAPLILTSIAAFTVNFSDRFFLRHFSTISIVGIYALGYKFGFMLSFLVVQPFDMIWSARMYEIAKQENGGHVFSRIFEYYTVVLVTAALGLSVIIKEVIVVVSAADFHSAYKVVPIVALAYVFQGWNRFFLTGTYIAKKTIYLAGIGAMSAAINIGLNFVLISRFGMMGAAWSTAFSFFAMAALSYMVSQKVYSIPYVFGRVAALLGLAAVFYLGSIMIPISSIVLAVLVKVVLVLLFPVGLFLVGFFNKDEKDKAKELAFGLLNRYRLRAAAASGR